MDPHLTSQLGVFNPSDRIDDCIFATGVQGAFFGSSMAPARIEALIAANIPRRHIVEIADVYQTRWWDYRRLAPGHSFMLFTHNYYKSFKASARLFMQHRNHVHGWGTPGNTGQHVAIVGVGERQYRAEDIWERDPRHTTGMFKAMLVADALGIPYDHFCKLANQIATDSKWQRLPRTFQLYSEKLGAQILDRWFALLTDRLILARHPLYDIEHYIGLEAQDSYRVWVLDSIERMPSPINALANAVYRKPQVPVDLAEARFSAKILERARLLAG